MQVEYLLAKIKYKYKKKFFLIIFNIKIYNLL